MTAETANVLLMILPLVIALTGLRVAVFIDRFIKHGFWEGTLKFDVKHF